MGLPAVAAKPRTSREDPGISLLPFAKACVNQAIRLTK